MSTEPQPGDEVASTLGLARYLLEHFGQDHSSGYIEVPKTVRELALATGRSPGTIQSHLRTMDELGIRIDSRQRLYDPTQLNPTSRSNQSSPTRQGLTKDQRALTALTELVDAAPTELKEAQQIAARILASIASRTTNQRDAQTETARPLRDQRVKELNQSLSKTNQSIDQIEDGNVARTARKQSTPHTRTAASLNQLLEPLIEICDRLKLPGITNSAGLTTRLAPYNDAQIKHATRKLIIEAKAGTCGQPIGKLANLAAEDSPDYFPQDLLATSKSPNPTSETTDTNIEWLDADRFQQGLASARGQLRSES